MYKLVVVGFSQKRAICDDHYIFYAICDTNNDDDDYYNNDDVGGVC